MAIKISAAEPTGTTVSEHNYLVAPRLDAWLLGGIGVVAWLFFSAPRWGLISQPGAIVEGPLFWLLLAISGTHFGASYHLAYGQGRVQVRKQAVLLIGVPVALLLVGVATVIILAAGGTGRANQATRFLLIVVFSLTTWHYIKQVYGVARVGASLNNVWLDPLSVRVLRYGLYPVWLLEAARIWSAQGTSTREGITLSYDLVPSGFVTVLSWITWISVVVVAGAFLRLLMQSGRVPATMWTPYAAGFLWLLFPPSYASVVLVFGALHAIQYLACAHRAEVSWGAERSPGRPALWWSSVFGGALASGLLLVYWLPALLTDSTSATTFGTIPAALLFVSFNLHHYAVDASIWRFGGQHIGRIVGKR